MLGFMLASFAGLSAALASLFMKLAFYEEHIIRDYLCTTWIEISANNCSKIWWCLRLAFIGGFFLANAVMWTLFVKALTQLQTSLQATVTSSAINFVTSAILGYLLFDEHLSKMWWLGALLIIIGLFFIHSDYLPDTNKQTHTD